MSFAARLVGFCFRQVVGHNAGAATEVVAELVLKHFTDHSQALLSALATANDRAWQALGVALAGDGFLDKVKVFFASGDDKGIREQVQLFLKDKSIGYQGTPADFRDQCLAELNRARQRNLLTARNLSPADVARHAVSFQRYSDPQKMVDGAEHAMRQISAALAADFPNLGKLLSQRPAGGSPLLVSAFSFFFRGQVETNAKLAHGLFFDSLRQLSASQDKAFAEVNKALTLLGSQSDRILEQIGRIETVVVETHGAVLDLQVELARIGEMNLANGDEVRRLLDEVLTRVSQLGMQRGEVKPHHSFSMRGEDERNAVKQLLGRFRQMPADQQQCLPALLNGLGKLQMGSGDFENARQTFVAVSKRVADVTAQAEVLFNAYRAALEAKKWEEALTAIQEAAALDSQRFAPFPMQRYQPKRILGAGGFGTAFLCHDRNFDEEVVVKTLHAADVDRSMTDVFREARLLRKLSHPAIIGVHECEFADPAKQVRPYLVIDYFPGGSLEDFLSQRGVISPQDMISIARQVADALNEAHRQDILHRDIKPDNVLVRKEESTWKIKVIDFGLALRKQTVETTMAVPPAGNTVLSDSVAGTLKYAPPEQLGQLKGVKAGPYSDVYAFGKMCCYALFGTTEPKRRHWTGVPSELHEMLEQCTEMDLTHRLPGFEPVLKVLEALDPARLRRKQEDEARRKAEAKRIVREREASEREASELAQLQRDWELDQLQRDGESKLSEFLREAYDRTNGKPTSDDRGAAKELVKNHRIASDRAKQIVDEAKMQWAKDHPPRKEPKPGEIITNCIGMKLAWIPPGRFLMGSPPGEEGRNDDETQHGVTLTKGYYLGIHPVTQASWREIIGDNPSHFKGEDLPVEEISWDDCQEFVCKLSDRDGQLYRLPTEAEWEHACRAGTTTPFSFGTTITSVPQDQVLTCPQCSSPLRVPDFFLPGVVVKCPKCLTPFTIPATPAGSANQVNYDGRYSYGNSKQGLYRRTTTPVGIFSANAWGLYDMHGNVGEWCLDGKRDYRNREEIDPVGSLTGLDRVIRGGSTSSPAKCCRSAIRAAAAPEDRYDNVGFRVVRVRLG